MAASRERGLLAEQSPTLFDSWLRRRNITIDTTSPASTPAPPAAAAMAMKFSLPLDDAALEPTVPFAAGPAVTDAVVCVVVAVAMVVAVVVVVVAVA
jgi:hypothetical protein